MASDALVLGFDTSAAHCAAALLSGDRLVVHRHEAMTRGQAERLFPLLEEVLAEAGATWADLEAVGVGTGPGNFTGLRIAVSAARGLALSLGRPAIGVTRFEAQALGLPRPVLSVIEAPRGQVYAQSLTTAGAETAELIPADRLDPGARVVGGATGAAPPLPLAEAVARIAADRLAHGEVGPRPAPLYVRPPDAAPSRGTVPTLPS